MERDLSQENMASVLEMSVTRYSRIERNEVDLNIERLQQVAVALNVKPEDILAFDKRVNFYNYENTKIDKQIGYNNFPQELKDLYEENASLPKDKIKLLEEKLAWLEKK